MASIDPHAGRPDGPAPVRSLDGSARPLAVAHGRVSPSSMANHQASNDSYNTRNTRAAWEALLATSPVLNPSLRAEPERRLAKRQYAKALVSEFRTDLLRKTALLSSITYGLPKVAGRRVADDFVRLLAEDGFFDRRIDILSEQCSEDWLHKGKQLLGMHGCLSTFHGQSAIDRSSAGSKDESRSHRVSFLVPRKRDILFKIELFRVCPPAPSPLDRDLGLTAVEQKNIALFDDLLQTLRLGPADFGLAREPEAFRRAKIAAARQTQHALLRNLQQLFYAQGVGQWAEQEAQVRPQLDALMRASLNKPSFRQAWQGRIAQEKQRYPDHGTAEQVRAARRAAHAARSDALEQAHAKNTGLAEPTVAQQSAGSV